MTTSTPVTLKPKPQTQEHMGLEAVALRLRWCSQRGSLSTESTAASGLLLTTLTLNPKPKTLNPKPLG